MNSSLTTPRFVLLALAAFATLAVIVAFPTFGAKPVYLDTQLAENTTLDRMSDVRAAFDRSSLDHQRGANTGAVDLQAITYRPVTMATLALTQATLHTLRAHHVVSLALHVLTALLVALVLRRSQKPDWVSLGLAAIVLVHPLAVEAWVWVSGRADLVAGLCIALLALATPSEARLASGARVWPRFILVAFVVFVGALAKETFVILAPAVAFRGLFARQVSWRIRGMAALAVALPISAALMLHHSVVYRGVAVPLDMRDLGAWLTRAPRLLADASATIVLPWHRPMRVVAFELLTDVGVVTGIGAVAFGLALASAALDRRWGLLLVVIAAALSIVPSAHVADSFWLGFDRFVFMPFVAVAIAFGESWSEAPASSAPIHAGVVLVVGVLAAIAHLQATDLRSTRTLAAAMSRARPGDPTGSLLRAEELFRATRLDEGMRMLESAPSTRVTPLESRRAMLLVSARKVDEAVVAIDALALAQADDPYAAKDEIAIVLARSRHAELPALARIANQRLGARRLACLALGGQGDRMKHAPPEQRRPFDRAYAILHCELGVAGR